MKRWLIALLCLPLLPLSISTARAEPDDVPLYACHESTGKVELVSNGDPTVRDLAVWMMGMTCKNVILAEGTATTTVTNIPTGLQTQAKALAAVLAGIKAAGLGVDNRKDTIIIKRLGARPCPDVVATKPVPPAAPVVEPKPEPVVTEAEIAAGVKSTSSTMSEIKQATVDAILSNPMLAARAARAIPAVKNGATIGMKLAGIKAGSWIAKLGFANGDLLKSINGLPTTNVDDALEVYTKIRDAKQLDIVVERGGKLVTLTTKVIP